MSRRSFLGKGALAVIALASVAVVAFAASASGSSAVDIGRFEAVSDGSVSPTQYVPAGRSNEPVTVAVQLGGKTVAEAQGDAGRQLSDAEASGIAAGLAGQQNALKSQIEALGGTILADFQYAYNGIKVRIAAEKVTALAGLSGVVGVHKVARIERDNVNSIPAIAAPAVWGGAPGFRGKGIKIAVIDTGVDYTHADFGGPGTVEAFNAANATDTLPADPSLFGPTADTKVKGGYDFAGDAYNATAGTPPQPDPNPLDCNGHGSHVAGTAAGYGVLADGSTYGGPWNASTVASNSWLMGPGSAPEADVYALRVFGCNGSTDLTVEAIEWAVEHNMDVINMSLGSSFGTNDDPSAVASTNAAKAGVIVVTSAGNSGANQYITGSPGAGTGTISVAASDAMAQLPAATLALSTGQTITAINANGYAFSPTTYNVKAILDNPATPTVNEALGCNPSDFGTLGPNTLAVVYRGTCARVAKAINGQKAGAAAVAMVNNSAALPPYEGTITSNPDTGEPYLVTIPLFGVRGAATYPPPASTDGGKLVAASGGTANATPTTIPNTAYKSFADFTSGGPRTGDSWLKPDVTAPGVSVDSVLVGGGTLPTIKSGTSMAAPAVAGLAALVKEAHPGWRVNEIKAAIVNTGNPAEIVNYRTSRGGTGLVHSPSAVATQAVAIGDQLTGSLSFGFEELSGDFRGNKRLSVRNLGSSPVTFSASLTNAAGSPHSVSLSASSVTVPAGAEREIVVTLSVPVSTVGNSAPGAGNPLGFREVAGLVTLTPAAGQNGGVTLRVPYYLVPRALSKVNASVKNRFVSAASPSTTASVENRGAIAGNADFYAWGLEDDRDQGGASNDMRAVGVQSFPFTATEQLLLFAVNVWDRWSNAATNEFDVDVDVDNDGLWDYTVVGVDQGAVQTGSFNGRMGTFVFSYRSPGASIAFFADAPTDSTTALLIVRSSQLCRANEPCLSAASPRFRYRAVSFDLANDGAADPMPGTGAFNAWSSSISQGMFEPLAPGASATVPVVIDPAEWAKTPAKGLMVVTMDDRSSRGDEADLVPVGLR